jgi:hypothetical protein
MPCPASTGCLVRKQLPPLLVNTILEPLIYCIFSRVLKQLFNNDVHLYINLLWTLFWGTVMTGHLIQCTVHRNIVCILIIFRTDKFLFYRVMPMTAHLTPNYLTPNYVSTLLLFPYEHWSLGHFAGWTCVNTCHNFIYYTDKLSMHPSG